MIVVEINISRIRIIALALRLEEKDTFLKCRRYRVANMIDGKMNKMSMGSNDERILSLSPFRFSNITNELIGIIELKVLK